MLRSKNRHVIKQQPRSIVFKRIDIVVHNRATATCVDADENIIHAISCEITEEQRRIVACIVVPLDIPYPFASFLDCFNVLKMYAMVASLISYCLKSLLR